MNNKNRGLISFVLVLCMTFATTLGYSPLKAVAEGGQSAEGVQSGEVATGGAQTGETATGGAQTGEVTTGGGQEATGTEGQSQDTSEEEEYDDSEFEDVIPEIFSVKATGGSKVTISFEEIEGVVGYAIYRWKEDDEDFDVVDECEADETKYVDKDVKPLTTYYYGVSIIYEDEDGDLQYGDYDEDGVRITTGFSKTKVKSVTSVRISQRLTWKKNKYAQGYFIYRRGVSSSKFKKIKTIKTPATTSYLDESVKLNKTYVYKVVAYAKDDRGKNQKSSSEEIEGTVSLKTKTKKITDEASSVYNKTLKFFYFGDGTRITDPEKYLSDEEKGNYVIYINKAKCQVMVYAKSGKTLIPIKSFICSPGYATPLGSHKTIVKLRWHELMGPCWGQWCTRVVSNGIYFHSIFYNSYNNNKDLAVGAYNRLGTICSHGCIRLQAYAAKWIFDNCSIGTPVNIVSKTGYEPLARPKLNQLPAWHRWDPTDPGAEQYCKEHHCHGK